MIRIQDIYIYPVKSLAGIKLTESELTAFGLAGDRRWMIVDKTGRFISQREVAKMATITTSFDNQQLKLSHNNCHITVPKVDSQAQQIEVIIWNDNLKASLVCSKVDKWLSEILQQPCQLVYMHDKVQRQIDTDSAPQQHYVSFADAFPLLVISQASLDDLNRRLPKPVDINRFRANIIVNGCQPFAEDNWQNFTINNIEYQAVKMCSRCIMPSINQQTGKQDQVKMLATLNSFRKFDKKIKFGMNIRYKNPDKLNGQSISCGDEIKLRN